MTARLQQAQVLRLAFLQTVCSWLPVDVPVDALLAGMALSFCALSRWVRFVRASDVPSGLLQR